jgi:hypothetical protein
MTRNRYNVFLYVRRAELNLDHSLSNLIVPEGTPFADISPLAFRIRKAIVRQLPSKAQERHRSFESQIHADRADLT